MAVVLEFVADCFCIFGGFETRPPITGKNNWKLRPERGQSGAQPTWLRSGTSEGRPAGSECARVGVQLALHRRLTERTLQTLSGFVDWMPLGQAMAGERLLPRIFCFLLGDEALRLCAAECLLQLLARKVGDWCVWCPTHPK